MFFEATYVPSSPTLSAKTLDEQETIEELEEKAVDHLIFVIHGIGQQTEQYGHFYEHLENIQIAIKQVLQAKIPDHNVRIELIPIEWHRHIHEEVDPIMHKITLKSIPTIRLIENEYLADVLFYFSKDKGQQIVDNVTQLFNTSYLNFMKNHPDFNGKIIILGYSLGGVITWDILAHQKTPAADELPHYQKLDVIFPKLEFKPHYFFGLGSPIGAVLTFRGQSPALYRPEPDIHFENIFHPFDPLGYRIEPLFSDDFIDQPAVLVERSFPIGPSFSFPSIPSLPTGGFFSFFNREQRNEQQQQQQQRQQKDKRNQDEEGNDVKKNKTEDIPAIHIEQQQPSDDDDEEDDDEEEEEEGEEDEDEEETSLDEQPEETSTSKYSVASIMHYFSTKKKKNNNKTTKSDTKTADEIGIITWDPLKDERTREQLVSLDDDALFDHLSQSSHTSSLLSIEDIQQQERRPSYPKSESSRHLVEVLGIDGTKMDSSLHQHHEDEEDDNNNSSSNIWVDLNEELHKPGPAITHPGQSKAEVAENATTTGDDDDGEKETKEVEISLDDLPGKRRMDHVLQPDSVMSMIANEYLVGLRAHFSYWTNKDFIWHMLRKIENHRDKEEEE